MPKSPSKKRKRIRDNECTGKYRYNDPESAARALRGWTRRIGGELEACPLAIYHCVWCSGWHVGRYIKHGRAEARFMQPKWTEGQLTLFRVENGRIVHPNPKRIQLARTL